MIYLDNAATSWPKPPEVVAAMVEQMRHDANPGRGGHRRAVAAQRMIDQSRLAVARLINADESRRIIFTHNGTDALNMAIHGVLRPLIDAGSRPHVVTTVLEHNSVTRPLNAIAAKKQIELTRVECGTGGVLEPGDIANAVRSDTALLVMTQVSNALGTIQPVESALRMVRERCESVIVVDASQALGVIPVDVKTLSADLIAAPGHKGLLGPTGTGVLYVGERVIPQVDDARAIATFREGGTGGDSTNPLMPAELPHHLEGGTANTVGIAGLGAGVRWLLDRGVDSIRSHEMELVKRLIDRLMGEGGIRNIGTSDLAQRVGTVSFVVDGMDPVDVAAMLDSSFEIAVRPGLHCAPGANRAAGTFPAGTVRASVGPFSTREEIDRLVDALVECRG